MTCYYPIQAFQRSDGKVIFRQERCARSMQVPCGRCIGCRLHRVQEWATRCVHESQTSEQSAFVTLTYDDRNLPPWCSLVRQAFPGFVKRLRSRLRGRRLSVFYAGEYGEEPQSLDAMTRRYGFDGIGRPHYHGLIFGFDFPDRIFWKKSRDGATLFRSPMLESLWPFGFSSIGAVTYQSAAYTASYSLKKVTGDQAVGWYQRVDRLTGECHEITPEFCGMSRRPALGRTWYDRFKSEVWQGDSVVVRGGERKPPRYYDKRLEFEQPLSYALVKEDRLAARDNVDNSYARLKVRGIVRQAAFNHAKGEL